MLFSRGQKIKNIAKVEQKDCFCNILDLIFYSVSRDLHSKYAFNFVFGSFFKQDHLLGLFILRVYAEGWPQCAHNSKQKLRTIPYEKA